MVLAAWIAYGAAKAKAYDAHPPPAINGSADDFGTELAAREEQSAFWAERKKEGAPAHRDLDKQLEIWRAGFLPELVIALHGRPGWTIPPAVLGKLRFEIFVHKFAGNYATGAPVKVKPAGGKAVPDVPGDDFPDPETLPASLTSCGRSIEERKAAWTRFAAIEPRLSGVPVSAQAPLGFAHRLVAAREEPEHRSRGVTWVSSRVGYLASLDGICAVERKDWPEAVRMLTKAVSLQPDDAAARLELALALTMNGRHDDALAQVTRAMGQTKNGCVIGLAWRRRGFILIEKGALDAAETSYKESLKYDPKNALALKELAHIAEMRRARGPGKADPTVVSVPAQNLSLTVCEPESAH